MPTGRPDYTLATDIVAQSLANLSVDIAVQSIGNLEIEIAAMSLANLDVDIEAQSLGNLSVDLAAQSIANLDVDIEAQTIGNIQIDIAAASIAALDVDIEAQTIGNIQIDIAAQAVDRMYILPQAPTGATTIFKSGTAAGSTVVLHTVTAGKTFHLTYANLTTLATGAANWGSLAVRNVSNVIQYYLARTKAKQGEIQGEISGASEGSTYGEVPTTSTIPVSVNPALEIPAGWDIAIISAAAVISCSAGVGGWES